MFNQRKNKKFNYKPRFQDSGEQTIKEDFESKWNAAKPNSKRRKGFSSLPTMIVFLIAVIVLMYILNGYMK